ncbi:T9SS type B sorting domain-containing protein [Halpernia sp.]|uniref:T9SS type B sorting domain-containing protein n=1 Tax=Halpernia sp. TaxID=2782209 RepID=UPI003A928903
MLYKKLICLLIIFYSFSVKAQLDLEHWLAPINWFPREGGTPQLFESKIYLSTPHETPFLVKLFDGDTVIASFMLSKSTPIIYDLSSDVYFTGDKFLFQPITRGLHIAGANSFYASYRISSDLGEEIITSKGKTAIGKHFFIAAAPFYVDEKPIATFFTSIYATKNNTKVTVNNKQNRIIFADGQKHSQFSFTLNKGESYSLKVGAKDNYSYDPADIPYAFSNDVFNEYIGDEIIADQPIAVVNGNDRGQVAFDQSYNTLYDQALPVKSLGQEYFVRNGFSTPFGSSEGALIIATEDNTKVFFNNETTPIILNKGQYYTTILSRPQKFIEHDATNVDIARNLGLYIKSSAKVYCYQFTAGSPNQYKGSYFATYCQSMSLVLPLDISLPGTVDFVPKFSKIGLKVTLDSRINIFLPTGQIPKINDVAVNSSTGPFNIKGTDLYKYFQVKIPKNTLDNLKVSANSGLVLNIINGHERIAALDFEDTKGFSSFYTGFSNDPYIIKQGNCIQEEVLLSLNNVDFEGFQWQLNGVDIPGANSPTYIPKIAGSYTCVLSYSTFTYTTKPIIVEDCPYAVSTTNLGNICANFTVTPKFTPPNENLNFTKVEILTQPNFGSAIIDNNKINVKNNVGFSGNDRFVYRITAANGFYETVKVEFSILSAPIADIKSEILNENFEDPNYIYNLNSAINNTNGESFHFYLTESDAENEVNEIYNLIAFSTNNPNEVFVRIKTSNGCFTIKKIILLKKIPIPPEPTEDVKLPNAFTPNGDGINDVWDYSLLKESSDLKLIIFDRFGKKVFERKSDSEDYFWDGKNEIQRPLPTGSYWVSYSFNLKNASEKISKSMWILLKNRN